MQLIADAHIENRRASLLKATFARIQSHRELSLLLRGCRHHLAMLIKRRSFEALKKSRAHAQLKRHNQALVSSLRAHLVQRKVLRCWLPAAHRATAAESERLLLTRVFKRLKCHPTIETES